MTRLHIDWTACDGRGLCTELRPELLTEDDLGYPLAAGPRPEVAPLAVAPWSRSAPILHLWPPLFAEMSCFEGGHNCKIGGDGRRRERRGGTFGRSVSRGVRVSVDRDPGH
ncbi:ferredoxin [Virgisporangium ochraceum]|uniref:Ferredoxin n=1 Tax=Virgisporangium ochraceum TaxID=65505 RepID=A0A8J3ZMY1_9ACTN|nr:hypothetical protein Voc01_015180 [Virgisporangium ochraceum]